MSPSLLSLTLEFVPFTACILLWFHERICCVCTSLSVFCVTDKLSLEEKVKLWDRGMQDPWGSCDTLLQSKPFCRNEKENEYNDCSLENANSVLRKPVSSVGMKQQLYCFCSLSVFALCFRLRVTLSIFSQRCVFKHEISRSVFRCFTRHLFSVKSSSGNRSVLFSSTSIWYLLSEIKTLFFDSRMRHTMKVWPHDIFVILNVGVISRFIEAVCLLLETQPFRRSH